MTTRTQLDAMARELLAAIAPDADPFGLTVDDDIRDSLDIDSVDFLNFVEAIHEKTGVDIPERDYSAVSTIAGVVSYLAARVESR